MKGTIKNDPIVPKKKKIEPDLKIIGTISKMEMERKLLKKMYKSGTHSYYKEHVLRWEGNLNQKFF